MAALLLSHISAGSANANNVTTSAIDTTGASLLVIVCGSEKSTGQVVMTDSQSNTWTALTAWTTTNGQCQIFYAANPTTSATHTFTGTLTASSPGICVVALGNSVTSSPFDQENGNAAIGGTSLSTGSITPTADNEILVAGVVTRSSGVANMNVNSFFAMTDWFHLVASQHYGVSAAVGIQGTAAAANPTFTWTTSVECVAAIASFKSVATSGGGGGAYAFCG